MYNPATGEIWRSEAAEPRRPRPKEGRTQEELIERCQSANAANGACPHSAVCQANYKCPFGAGHRKAVPQARLRGRA